MNNKSLKKIIAKILSFILVFTSLSYIQFYQEPLDTVKGDTHIHTSDCYPSGATVHTHIGNNRYSYGCFGDTYEVVVEKCKCTGTYEYVCPVYRYTGHCQVCGMTTTYTSVDDYGTNGTLSNDNEHCGASILYSLSSRQVLSRYECNGCGRLFATNDAPPAVCGFTKTTIAYQCICGKEEGSYYYSNGSLATPVCNEVVTELVPTNENQIISAGASPDLTATATFLDGHTEIVTCSVSGFSDSTYNVSQDIVLSYGTYSDTAKNATPKTAAAKITILGYFELTTSSSDTNMGTVNGDSGTILYGKTETVSASAKPGYSFAGWYNGSTLVSSDASYTFNMPAYDYNLIAKFTINQYMVKADIDAERHGTVEVVNGEGLRDYLSSVTVKQTTNTGYTFIGWYEGDSLVSMDDTYSFILSYHNTTLTAKYRTNPYRLSVGIDNVLHGTTSISSGGAINYFEDEVSVNCTTEPGYTFDGWYENNVKVSSNSFYEFYMTNYDLSLIAKYTVNQYFVQAYTDTNDRGTITVLNDSRSVDYRTVSTVQAVPKDGCYFIGWYNEYDELISNDLTYSFEMPYRNVILNGKFGLNEYMLFVNDPSAGVGKIDISTEQSNIIYGTSVTVKATAYIGYVFVGWSDGTDIVSFDANYTFTMPANDLTLTPVFKEYVSVTAKLNESFYSAYGKLPYYNGIAFDINYPITLSKYMVDVTAVFDDGTTQLLEQSDFTFLAGSINKIGTNLIIISATVSNLSLTAYIDDSTVSGYSDQVSDALDDAMSELGVESGDYEGLKDAVLNMYDDLGTYREFVNKVKKKLDLTIEEGTDASSLATELSQTETEIVNMYQKMIHLKDALKVAFDNYQIDVNDVNDIYNTVVNLQDLQSTLLSNIAELDAQIIILTVTDTELDEKILEQTRIHDELIANNTQLEGELTTLQNELSTVTDIYNKTLIEYNSIRTKLDVTEKTLTTLKENISRLQVSSSYTTSQIQEYKRLITELTANQISLNQQYNTTQEQLVQLQTDYSTLQTQLDELPKTKTSAMYSETVVNSVEYSIRQQTLTTTDVSSSDLSTLVLLLDEANNVLSERNSMYLKD